MTFRAKPVANKPRRQSRDSEPAEHLPQHRLRHRRRHRRRHPRRRRRRPYYGDHLAPAATVGGQTITRTSSTSAAAIEVWRLQQQQAADPGGGRGRAPDERPGADADPVAPAAGPDTRRSRRTVLEKLIDGRIQADLATEAGHHASPPEQIDAKIVEENRRRPEQRHAWIIAVEPEVDEGKTEPTDAQKAAAKKIADQALAGRQDRRQEVGGRREGRLDRPVEGDRRRPRLDRQGRGRGPGVARRGLRRSSEQADRRHRGRRRRLPDRPGHRDRARPRSTRPGTRSSNDAGLKRRRATARRQSEVIRQALEDKAVADATKARTSSATSPRSPSQAPRRRRGDEAVKVRHILFSPKDDPQQGASDLPADDPAWTEAQLAAAEAAYDELGQGPDEVRLRSPAPRATRRRPRATTGTGGKLPYFDSSERASTRQFEDAILKPTASSPATSCSRSRAPSAGTSSRSCTARRTPTR